MALFKADIDRLASPQEPCGITTPDGRVVKGKITDPEARKRNSTEVSKILEEATRKVNEARVAQTALPQPE